MADYALKDAYRKKARKGRTKSTVQYSAVVQQRKKGQKAFFCFGGKKELLAHLCPSGASKNAVANGGGINFAVTGNRKRERPDLLCFADEI